MGVCSLFPAYGGTSRGAWRFRSAEFKLRMELRPLAGVTALSDGHRLLCGRAEDMERCGFRPRRAGPASCRILDRMAGARARDHLSTALVGRARFQRAHDRARADHAFCRAADRLRAHQRCAALELASTISALGGTASDQGTCRSRLARPEPSRQCDGSAGASALDLARAAVLSAGA